MAIETLYPAIRPSLDLNFAGSKTLDPRITFSRASAATYYDGRTVAKAEENLLLYSQEINNTVWGKSAVVVTANTTTTAPDGTNTAEFLLATDVEAEHYIGSSNVSFATGSTYTHSVYAKAGGLSFIRIAFASTVMPSLERAAWFNLSNGTTGTVQAGITASIQSVGNGWYRCSISRAATASQIAPVFATGVPADNNLSYTGDGVSGVYIWGAQLEQRSQVTAYTPTTTQPITNYIPVLQTALAGVPRFDHNPVTGESLGLLVEEQRTNLLPYSEQLDNFNWLKTACTALPNAITAPDGSISADRLVEDSSNASHYIGASTQSVTSGITYTATIYAKASDRTVLQMLPALSAFGAVFANFDLSAGTLGTVSGGSASITHVGNNWYRCSFTVTATATVATGPVNFALQTSATAARAAAYQGNGYSGIYIWGAQLEAGAFPTSYIKTEASQVTRATDSAQMTGANFSSWYRQDEGSIFAEFQQYPGVPSSSQRVLQIGYPSQADGHLLFRASDRFTAGTYFAGAYQASTNLTEVGTESKKNKAAYSYKVNSFIGAGNGNLYSEDTLGLLPTPVALYIGTNAATTHTLNGYIRRISFYPKALPNNIQALTA